MVTSRKRQWASCRAFTLVELLVVMAIIGILSALLIPAVQAAREAARKAQCANQLKQMGVASHVHHDVHRHFPASGWQYLNPQLAGDPDLGFGLEQPGSWIFNLLPYMEQGAVHDLAAGKVGDQKKAMLTQMLETTLVGFNCPSLRAPKLYPWVIHRNGPQPDNFFYPTKGTFSADYAGSAGSRRFDGWHDGVIFVRAENDRRSLVAIRDVTDGLSCTYLIGEKFLDLASQAEGGWSCLMSGSPFQVARYSRTSGGSTSIQAVPPKMNVPNWHFMGFGSSHPGSLNFLYCDGSVRQISYDIHWVTHARYADRRDGLVPEQPDLGPQEIPRP